MPQPYSKKQVLGGPGSYQPRPTVIPELTAVMPDLEETFVLLSTTTTFMTRGYQYLVEIGCDDYQYSPTAHDTTKFVVCAPSRDSLWRVLWQYNLVRRLINVLISEGRVIPGTVEQAEELRRTHYALSGKQLGTMNNPPDKLMLVEKNAVTFKQVNVMVQTDQYRMPPSEFASKWSIQHKDAVIGKPINNKNMFKIDKIVGSSKYAKTYFRDFRGIEFGIRQHQFAWVHHPNLPRTLAKTLYVSADKANLQDVQILCMIFGGTDDFPVYQEVPEINVCTVKPRYLQPLDGSWIRWFNLFRGSNEDLEEATNRLREGLPPSQKGCSGPLLLDIAGAETQKPRSKSRRTFIEID